MASSLVRIRTPRNLSKRFFMARSLLGKWCWSSRTDGRTNGRTDDGRAPLLLARVGIGRVLETVDVVQDGVGVEDGDGEPAALGQLQEPRDAGVLGVAGLGGAEDALAAGDDHLHAADEKADQHG